MRSVKSKPIAQIGTTDRQINITIFALETYVYVQNFLASMILKGMRDIQHDPEARYYHGLHFMYQRSRCLLQVT